MALLNSYSEVLIAAFQNKLDAEAGRPLNFELRFLSM